MGFLNDIEVGKRLEKLRGTKSSRKTAMEAGIDPSQYKKIEKGEIALSNNILEKLVNKYNWNEEYILYGNGKNVPRGTKQEEEIVIKTDLEKLLGEQMEAIATLQAAVKVLTLKVIEHEVNATGKSFSQVSLDLESMMKSKAKEISDELSRK